MCHRSEACDGPAPPDLSVIYSKGDLVRAKVLKVGGGGLEYFE